MIQQQANTLTFYAFFTELKVGKSGLTVNVTVYENGVSIVGPVGATEIGSTGLYKYALASGSVDANGEYIAIFTTATTTVDVQHIPALWVVPAWVANLDTNTASRASAATALSSATWTDPRAGYLDALNTGVPLADGIITAAKIATDAIDADALSADALNEIAAVVLKYDWTLVSGEASRSTLNALRALRNLVQVVADTLTVMEEDDTTPAWTAAVTHDPTGAPITKLDPS